MKEAQKIWKQHKTTMKAPQKQTHQLHTVQSIFTVALIGCNQSFSELKQAS